MPVVSKLSFSPLAMLLLAEVGVSEASIHNPMRNFLLYLTLFFCTDVEVSAEFQTA